MNRDVNAAGQVNRQIADDPFIAILGSQQQPIAGSETGRAEPSRHLPHVGQKLAEGEPVIFSRSLDAERGRVALGARRSKRSEMSVFPNHSGGKWFISSRPRGNCRFSNPLENGGDSLSDADAHRGQSEPGAAIDHGIDQRGGDPRTAAPSG